jgi:hypothetical protein
LTVFLAAVLSKKYTNPSSDIITILAGLHDADAVLSDLVGTIDGVIKNGRSSTTIPLISRILLTICSRCSQKGDNICPGHDIWSLLHGSHILFYSQRPLSIPHEGSSILQLISLFLQSPKFILDSDSTVQTLEPFALLGLLANYNKFEFQNPYRTRLEDFVNETIIKKTVLGIGATCALTRDKYVAIQDDIPEEWSIGSTLATIGLGSFVSGRKPAAPVLTAEEAKLKFAELPGLQFCEFKARNEGRRNAAQLVSFTHILSFSTCS